MILNGLVRRLARVHIVYMFFKYFVISSRCVAISFPVATITASRCVIVVSAVVVLVMENGLVHVERNVSSYKT